MSTRSMVGVGTPTNYQARYCHADGYPTGIGKALWENWHTTFQGDLQKLADFILMTDYGWSMLAGTDFSLDPRWYEYAEWEQYNQHPRWYDTRNPKLRGDAWHITQDFDASDSWLEWAYLIDLENNQIGVYKIKQSGLKFVGTMLANEEPDYQELEK